VRNGVTDVVFPLMPFADVGRPALGVSLLNAAARRMGITSSVVYFNLDFAERCGLDIYRLVSDLLPPDALLGEWLFADLFFGAAIPSAERYIAGILAKFALGPDHIADILGARALCARFIESCARQLETHRPRVVAFSTTFHQTCACLALARRLKTESNPPIVIFGGANCEGEMGVQLLRSFESIDFVSVQEADQSFPAFLTALATGERPSSIAGIIGRDEAPRATQARLAKNLDDLPIPDYGEYFEALRGSPFAGSIVPELPMETSRGCWWGEKHHCTFCGLNGGTMAYRRKSEDRVLSELRTLTQQYDCRRVFCVDNILDFRFIDTLFPRLEQSRLGVELFFEVKANLKRHQLEMLKAGGVRFIQPGIESFSTQVLQLMRKGSTGETYCVVPGSSIFSGGPVVAS
jgi:ribosomal peptide maturation radical SAM protein 1